MKLADELEKLAVALSAAGVEYALCGGLAMAVHGHVRATEDIDILVRESDLDEIITVAESIGYHLHTGWMTFNAQTAAELKLYRIVKVEGTDHVMLDLLMVAPAFEEEWKHRQTFHHDGVDLTVMTAHGLALMKRGTGRTKDQIDVEWLDENARSSE